jgi:hypothetical protein
MYIRISELGVEAGSLIAITHVQDAIAEAGRRARGTCPGDGGGGDVHTEYGGEVTAEEPGLPSVPAADVDHGQLFGKRGGEVFQVGLEVARIRIPGDLAGRSVDARPPAFPVSGHVPVRRGRRICRIQLCHGPRPP